MPDIHSVPFLPEEITDFNVFFRGKRADCYRLTLIRPAGTFPLNRGKDQPGTLSLLRERVGVRVHILPHP
jgi:hypothetical protein